VSGQSRFIESHGAETAEGRLCVGKTERKKYSRHVRDISPHAWLEGALNLRPLISRIVVARLCNVDSTCGCLDKPGSLDVYNI
jgi:hypothetical protein